MRVEGCMKGDFGGQASIKRGDSVAEHNRSPVFSLFFTGGDRPVAEPRARSATPRRPPLIPGNSAMTRRTILAAAAAFALWATLPAAADTLVVCSEASPDFMNPQF